MLDASGDDPGKVEEQDYWWARAQGLYGGIVCDPKKGDPDLPEHVAPSWKDR